MHRASAYRRAQALRRLRVLVGGALGAASRPCHNSSICAPFGSVCTSRAGSQPSDGASHMSMRRVSPSRAAGA